MTQRDRTRTARLGARGGAHAFLSRAIARRKAKGGQDFGEARGPGAHSGAQTLVKAKGRLAGLSSDLVDGSKQPLSTLESVAPCKIVTATCFFNNLSSPDRTD